MSVSFSWPLQPPPKTTPGQQYGVKRSAAGKPHTGLDMGNSGEKVLAAAGGVIAVSLDTHDARGRVVYIKHEEGYETRYMHLASSTVRKGDIVSAGEQVGVVGISGLPKPWPHLHFELLQNGSYINPTTLLPSNSSSPANVGGNSTSASQYPSDAPSISSGVWPVSGTKDYRVSQGRSGRALGAERSSGARTHAGIDLFGKHKDTIVAITDGEIVNFYFFYRGTFCLFVNHGSVVVNYGEVEPDSLDQFGLKTPSYRSEKGPTMSSSSRGASTISCLAASGSKVQAGQPIAKVGKMFRSSMLHIEMYSSGKTNKQWKPFQSSPPSGLMNPTNTLIEIATGKRVARKENIPTEVVCR